MRWRVGWGLFQNTAEVSRAKQEGKIKTWQRDSKFSHPSVQL